ncbi:aldo/keto reductase [Streptomyces sp. NBC_01210]|uniref:aldo/keto reductase n=1 Tax=Streptomyces sp. NBC_01210 TaxID=2903774 RepID=UPI002E13298E|nr:aldo/keto reductase [Streptomyces sp. NBC_01210]
MTDNKRDPLSLPFSQDAETLCIVLGGRFGEEPEQLSFERLERFSSAGGQWVDTAHSYADGRSEEIIGKWMSTRPGTLRVMDKIGHPSADGSLDLTGRNLRKEAEQSCRRLQVPSLDVVMLHRDDPGRTVEELVETLVGLVSSGLAARVGVSNWRADRLAELVPLLVAAGHVPVVSYQFSLAVPSRPLWPGTLHECDALRAVITQHDLPLVAWAGQARGFFAGAGEPVGPGVSDPFDTPRNRERRRRCQAVAHDLGVRPETVALAWTLHRPGVWPVIGARSVDEVDISMAASSLTLDETVVQWLKAEDGKHA